MWNTVFRWMTELSSRKSISQLTGRFAKSSLSKRLIPRFAKMYGINVEEAEKAVHEYASLNEFFTRRLKPGMRMLDEREDAVISPVDARITGIGLIEEGTLLNVKGQDYTAEDLLNQSPRAVNYRHGFYIVLYLSPTDYHRIHCPVSGKLVEKEHVRGKVYPVNDFGMRYMKGTLSRNERLITYIRHSCGEVAVVKVGAMNVSSIQYVEPLESKVERGQELAYFEFGSTVVLLFESETFLVRPDLMINSKVKMGESLGVLRS